MSLAPDTETWAGNGEQMRCVKCLETASCLVTLSPFWGVAAFCGPQALQGDIPVSQTHNPAQAGANQGMMVTPYFYPAKS